MPFVKGQSGNPKGRPKKGHTLSDAIKEALDKRDVQKGYDKVTRNQAIAEVLTQEALKGNLTAINMVLDRMEGRPMIRQEIDMDAKMDVPMVKIVHEKKKKKK